MTTAQFALLGTTLKSVGLSLFGGGAITVPAGAPVWLSTSVIAAGVVLQIAGVIFSHLAQAQTATQSSDTSIVVKTAQAKGQLPPTPIIVPVPVEPTKTP